MINRIGIIGLGNVGEATVDSLKKYSSLITHRTSLKIDIKGLCDVKEEKKGIAGRYSLPFTTDPYSLINDPEIDTIVELIGGIEPACGFIVEALKKGKNIVTANKALLAERGKDIFALVRKQGKSIGFEASVCGAIPIIKAISHGLVGCEVNKFYGILNGTTNYILYKMGKDKIDFASALKEAQRKGIAEKDPSLDIEGVDALHKICILSYLCFGVWPNPKKVYTEGISNISLLDILYAQELNYRIKLLAIAKRERKSLDLRVHPALVARERPLAEVGSVFNAVSLDTQPAGELLFYGKGAGGMPTSSAVISDIVNIGLGSKNKEVFRKEKNLPIKNIKEIKMRYYIRFMSLDKPGVLAQVSKILASLNISISSVHQKEKTRGKFVPIVMLTHEAKEENIKKAISRIDNLAIIKNPSQVIRIENL